MTLPFSFPPLSSLSESPGVPPSHLPGPSLSLFLCLPVHGSPSLPTFEKGALPAASAPLPHSRPSDWVGCTARFLGPEPWGPMVGRKDGIGYLWFLAPAPSFPGLEKPLPLLGPQFPPCEVGHEPFMLAFWRSPEGPGLEKQLCDFSGASD